MSYEAGMCVAQGRSVEVCKNDLKAKLKRVAPWGSPLEINIQKLGPNYLVASEFQIGISKLNEIRVERTFTLDFEISTRYK